MHILFVYKQLCGSVCSVPLVALVLHSSSQDVLARIQANQANKVCADCSAMDPSWGVINRGMMVCINCSGMWTVFELRNTSH